MGLLAVKDQFRLLDRLLLLCMVSIVGSRPVLLSVATGNGRKRGSRWLPHALEAFGLFDGAVVVVMMIGLMLLLIARRAGTAHWFTFLREE